MKVRDVMTRNVTSIQSTDTVIKAAKIMRDCNIGAVPVFAGNNEVGIVTDRDITTRVTAEGLDCTTETVRSIMSTEVRECAEDDDLGIAAHMMEKFRIRRILVRNAAGKIVGIVSLGDLAVRGDKRLSEEILEQVCQAA